MPRYFFHVVDGKFLVDDEGTECAGLSEVREQALATAGAILKDYAPRFPSGTEWQMHVTDESKTTLFKLRFSMEEHVSFPVPKLTVVGGV
jgi:hypothetical protein